MDSFMKKIFEGKADGNDKLVHLQFQKFSKGEFNSKAGLILKSSKGKFTLATTPEYGNELVRALAEEIIGTKVMVNGALITTIDLSKEYEFKEVKNALGVRKHFIEKEMTGKEILDLQERFPRAFFALSFSTPISELSIKIKAPKTKPSGKGEEKPKVDFCKLKTTNKEIVEKFVFDVEVNNIKKVEINHSFLITDLEIPKNETDLVKMREDTKRKGKIIRKITIEDKTETKEANFVA